MKRRCQLFAAAAMLTAMPWLGGCKRQSGPTAAAEAGSRTAGPARVLVGPPVRKTLVATTTQPARIEAYEETPLFAKLAGFVEAVSVDIGDRVKKGQPLAMLHIPELQNEVAQKVALIAQAEAEVKLATAQVDAAQAAAETAEAKIAEAQAGVSRARADAERWSAEYRRIEQLAASGSVTQKLVDETRSQQVAAAAAQEETVAAVQSAAASAREAKAMIGKAEADRVAAEARRGVANANLARAQTMLGYATITAPFDGVVTARSIDTGHFVQPASGASAKPLFVVARTDRVRVFLDIPEMDAGLVDVNDPVMLKIQALQGKELKGAVTRTSWSLDATNRSLRVEVDLPNDNTTLRPGMYAVGVVELDRRENVLTLPVTAIVRTEDETYSCCVKDNKIDRRRVELGLRSGADVELRAGIDEGDVVVLSRADALLPGQTVQAIESNP